MEAGSEVNQDLLGVVELRGERQRARERERPSYLNPSGSFGDGYATYAFVILMIYVKKCLYVTVSESDYR